MHRAFAICLLTLPALSACQDKTNGDAVREAYDNKADAIDQQAARQPTAMARRIYKDRADSFREEGKDREKGIEGGSPSKGPVSGAMPVGNSQ